ncbi:Type II secretory pathway, component PulJ [Andreprevotia lacus DSM 23236]|jgi:type II secretory pathway component PulJ|uniref:Type II secretory pathway, component PulJ n=1 Tax=Andreprevotia lacus DSM 23236 TaxID=1121001 RepID=A0A1W1XGR7_9NEIS|nr:hypothetical protein [Andreprevotia lacus]SMC22718.1 Type II secretory pathway, component PulJ [Andreprevotia lacus DSM 23236]
MLKRKHMGGFTLMEFLVGALVSSAVLYSISLATVNNLRSAGVESDRHKLNATLRQVLDIMTRDIGRSGYWANAASLLNSSNSNPYSTITNTASCVLFSYNRDTPVPSLPPADDEQYGFAFTGNAVYARTAGTPWDCNNTTAWSALTDSNVVEITSLTITRMWPEDTAATTASATEDGLSYTVHRTVSGNSVLCVREYQISLSGRLKKKPTITQTYQATIKVRNDEVKRGVTSAPTCA